MSVEVRLRRGSAVAHSSFTGANGEVTYDFTNKTIVAHDGLTAGGSRLAKRVELDAYLQVTNAAATYQTKAVERAALANTNAFVKSQLANTNLAITNVKNNLTSTNTALRTLISDRLQVANASATYLSKTTAANTYLNNKTVTAQSVNSAVTFSKSVTVSKNLVVSGNASLTGLIANGSLGTSGYALKTNGTTVYWGEVVATGGGSTTKYLEVANAVATYQTIATEKAHLANTNASVTNVKNNLTSTNTALRTLISDRLQVANAASTYQTKAVERAALANTNAFIKSQLANTNASVTNVKNNLTSTNTALRTLIADRIQIANLALTYATKTYVDTSVAAVVNSAPTTLNTLKELADALGDDPNFSTTITALIGTKASNSYVKSTLANTNLAITNVKNNLTSTNTALRTLISDRLQVANASSTYLTKTAAANTYLNSKTLTAQVVNSAVTFNKSATVSKNLVVSGNATVSGLIANGSLGTSGYALKTNGTTVYWGVVSATGGGANATVTKVKISDLNVNNFVVTDVTGAYTNPANLTPYLQVANAVSTYQTKAVERAALANTNASISNAKTNLTSTNTALRTLISDRLQVANAAATYQTKAIERAALANTNASVTNVKNNLTSTNTALRTLISDRLQVANASSTYQTKAVERAALANTNAFVKSQLANTNLAITNVKNNLTSTNTALRTLISDRLQVANASANYLTKTKAANTYLNNKTVTGQTVNSAVTFNKSLIITKNLTVSGNTTLSATSETVTAVSALVIDCSTANYFTKTIANATNTFTFSNPPATGAFVFTLELTLTSGAVTWPTSVKWPSDTAPTLSTGKTSLLTFVTSNGGTRWRGSSLIDYTT